MYAVNDVESYNIMEQLKKDIDKNLSKKDVHFLIIGTKLDLKQRRVEAAVAVRVICAMISIVNTLRLSYEIDSTFVVVTSSLS